MATTFFHAEALPHQERWAAQKCVDRDFWYKAGELGLLCASIPEQYGGGGTLAHDFAIFEAQAACGETGFGNQVHSVLDRIKDMIITGGENVYSAEVENALAKRPAVAAVAVIGVPDPDWGERVHAVVVLLPGRDVTEEQLRAHCKTLVAGYKAPRSMDFVDAMPMSGAGKILKRELRMKY